MTTKKATKKTKAVLPTERASTTKTFLKSRVSKPTLGKWSSGFSAVKKYAEDNDVPLIAVWSNGDVCGHCVNFEKSISQSDFTKWMSSSGCVFWFGCSSDKSKDDKFEGTGFMWTRGGKLSGFPFCRVYWKSGKVDTFKSGDDWTGGTAKGGATFVKKLKDLLKNYKPGTTTTTTTTTPEPEAPITGTTCENCSNDGCSKEECDKLKEQVKNLTEKVEMLDGLASSYMEQIRQKDVEIAETKNAVNTFINEIQDAINKIELGLGI